MKTILLAVCGLTPQVITETLYALHQQGKTVDAIRILTTREGKSACIAQLLGADDGHFYRYLDEYEIPRDSIDFSPRHVIAVTAPDGREIDDIDSEQENELFLRACMDHTFELTRDRDSAVFFSLAGGRKTMSACLSLAAQCYGRPQDRIYHVLVSPEFERCRDFYYPPIEPRQMQVQTRDRKPCVMNSNLAQVTLVPLPFFSLRDQLSDQMLKGPETPQTLMLSLVREDKGELLIDLLENKVIWKGVEAELSPACLAFYAFFAKAKKEDPCATETCRNCYKCYLKNYDVVDRRQEILDIYQKVKTREAENVGFSSLEIKRVREYKSKLKKELLNGFGPYEAEKIMIQSDGKRFPSFGISVDRKKIKIVF